MVKVGDMALRPRKSGLPAWVSAFKGRGGVIRYRFRRTGFKSMYLRGEPGSPEFVADYRAALGEFDFGGGSNDDR